MLMESAFYLVWQEGEQESICMFACVLDWFINHHKSIIYYSHYMPTSWREWAPAMFKKGGLLSLDFVFLLVFFVTGKNVINCWGKNEKNEK